MRRKARTGPGLSREDELVVKRLPFTLFLQARPVTHKEPKPLAHTNSTFCFCGSFRSQMSRCGADTFPSGPISGRTGTWQE